jgi:TldD protein
MILEKQKLQDVLSEGLSSGADFCEIFVEDNRTQRMLFSSSRLESLMNAHTLGAGIRLFYGLEQIYTHTNDLSFEGLIRAARSAALALAQNNHTHPVELQLLHQAPLHVFELRAWDIDSRKKLSFLREMDGAARATHSDIRQFEGFIGEYNQRVQIANSLGRLAEEERNYIRVSAESFAEQNGRRESSYVNRSFQAGSEILETLPFQTFARNSATSLPKDRAA